MAPHSSTLAWKIPWAEEPGRLQSMGSQRVRYDSATSLSLFTFMHWRRKWQPTPVFLPGESQRRGAWWAAVYGVAQSRTRLKQLSSSSSNKTRDVHIEQKDHMRTQWEGSRLQAKERALSRTCQHSDHQLPASRTVRNKFCWFSHSVGGLLLWQP